MEIFFLLYPEILYYKFVIYGAGNESVVILIIFLLFKRDGAAQFCG